MGFFSSYSGNDKKAVNVEFVLKMLDRLIPPVGAIYMSASYNNPSTIYPNTVWTEWGKGRVPVGVDAGQTEFNTVEKTGGEKAHTLTIAEMPSHTHIQNSHNHTQNPHGHTTSLDNEQVLIGVEGHWYGAGGYGNVRQLAIGKTTAENTATTATNQNTGDDSAHNNLQPYITCYMWKRMA
jgi:microcystin-dependent protein